MRNIPRNNVLVLPADLVAETTDGAVLATRLQSQDTEGLGNNHLLLLVVRGRDTLEDLEALKGGGTAGGLVGDHAADGLVEDAGGSAEVEGTTTSGVETGHLAEVGVVLDCSRQLAFCSQSRHDIPPSSERPNPKRSLFPSQSPAFILTTEIPPNAEQ